MDLWQFIAADHDNADELFRETLRAIDGGVQNRRQLFEQLKLMLDQHARMEEAVFYPALQQYEATRDLVADGLEEHRKIKESLAELSAGDKDGAEWTGRFKELQQLVEHHVRDEEHKMFPAAREVLDQRKAESLLKDMEHVKLEMLR